MPTAHEHFSEQFYRWEKRGRGWQVFSEPVSPEPPFAPFQFRPMAPVVDNSVRPSFLGSLLGFGKKPEPPPEIEPEEEPEPSPLERSGLVELQVALPADLDIGRDAMEHLFHNLSLCREPIAFELLGTAQRVLAQFVASGTDAPLVRKQLTAYFPDVLFREQPQALIQAWNASSGADIHIHEFGLKQEFMLSLESGKIDSFVGLIGALAELQAGELALFQVIFQPVDDGWAESMITSVSLPDGKPLFVNAPKLTSGAEAKAAQPLYAVVVRLCLRTASAARSQQIGREFAGALCAFAKPQGNGLIPLHNDDYDDGHYLPARHLEDVLRRQTRRSGMILNSDELFNFVHLPSSAVRTPALERDTGRTKAAPITQPSSLVIGDNEHNGDIVPVYLSTDQRVRHTHIIGIPGTGKSSLLFNLIRQDIENGEGVALLDPHGDLVDQLLGIIPEDRIDDVVLVNLSDTDFPIGFNILQAHSEDEKALLASDLIAVLRRFSTSWGDQMDIVLLNAILAFLDSTQGGTLADLRRFLLETPYRNQFLETVSDLEIKYYWREVFPKSGAARSAGSVLTRLQDFFSRKPLRNMVSQQKNKLNFADIMDHQKIFLARLPEGLNGAENVQMLGALLVSKFQQTAMARQSQVAADRKDFWLYVDEFDHFISPSMASILTGARKYRLGLTLCHQELHQLQSEPKVASAVNASVCTRIVLRVGNDDAKKLGEGFAFFEADRLKNLEDYHAIARIERNDCDFNLALRPPELPEAGEAAERREQVIAKSREQYGTPRAEVEAAWLASLGLATESPDTQRKTEPPAEPAKTKPIIKPAEPEASVPVAAELPPPELPKVAVVRNRTEIPKPAEVPQIAKLKLPENHRPLTQRDLGRGSKLHKDMQKRITKAAEAAGFGAEPEKQLVAGSNEAADVLLQRGKIKLAVEIALTASGSVNHEYDNVEKCLSVGVDRVYVLANDQARLDAIAAAVRGGLDKPVAAKVRYQTAEDFITGLPALAEEFPVAPPPPGVQVIDGVIVRSSFPSAPDLEKDKVFYQSLAGILGSHPKTKNPKPKRR